MLALRLPKKLEKQLEMLAAKTGRTKSYYARKAITEFLESEEDYVVAATRLRKQRPGIPLKEVERRLGLAR